MAQLSRLMIITGVILIILGVALSWGGFSRLPFGRLPGDIRYQTGNVHFFFPFSTCLLLSSAFSLILLAFRWFTKR